MTGAAMSYAPCHRGLDVSFPLILQILERGDLKANFETLLSILHANSLVCMLPGGKPQTYWLYPCCSPLLLPVKEQRPRNKITVIGQNKLMVISE